jgi:hypothetical protein
MMSVTILAKTYPGTGRPNSMEIVKDGDLERIEYLKEAWGYYVLATGQPADVDPWDKYTLVDADGFTQWK